MSMEDQAKAQLSEDVLAVAIASPKGQGKKILTAGIARQLAGVAGAMAVEKAGSRKRGETPGGFTGGYMVIALTPTQLAFFARKQGLLKPSVGNLLESVPRDEIAGFEFGGGTLTTALTISFSDGTSWELEVPRANKTGAEKLAKLFKPG